MTWLSLLSLLIFISSLLPGRYSQTLAEHTSGNKDRLVYEATVQNRQGNRTVYVKILYDRPKFREEINYDPSKKDRPAKYMEIYDGSEPAVAWSYNAVSRSAWPLPESSLNALSDMARRKGEASVRQRYSIPAGFGPIVYNTKSGPPHPTLGLLTKTSFPQLTGKPLGIGQVAGYTCHIYQVRIVSENPTAKSQHGTTVENNTIRLLRVWVEPRTQLILRLEDRIIFSPGSPAPPMLRSYIVEKLQLPKSIPTKQFQLPPGTTANVPLIFKDVRLPKGVKRVTPTSPPSVAGIGVDLEAARRR